MNSQHPTDLSDADLQLVNAECDAFAEAIVGDQPPRIEDHIESVDPSLRDVLFGELLAVELEQRIMRGETPDFSEYSKRFPEAKEQTRRVFERVSSALSATKVFADADADTQGLPDGEAPTLGFGSSAPGTAIRQLGDYEIVRVLGQGGMGVVYEARQISLNRAVALKMIKPGLLDSDDGVRRFRNEADAVALLDHPGIVRTLVVAVVRS